MSSSLKDSGSGEILLSSNQINYEGREKSDNAEKVDEEKKVSSFKVCLDRLVGIYNSHSLLCLICLGILLAYIYPPLGADYLQPKITATWIAVFIIFILSGLGLKTEEFKKALTNLKFNVYSQSFNFFVISGSVYGITRLLVRFNILTQSISDGMVVCASVPNTINMMIVLSASSKGDEAAAVFNAAFGNMIGIFLTPALLFGYLGVDSSVDIGSVFLKLALRVVLPICIGQLLQKFSKRIVEFKKKYKKRFKTFQEYCLTFIVYTVFCKTFKKGSDTSVGEAFIMIALQGTLIIVFKAISWNCMKFIFPREPKLRVTGLFGSTHKSVAMGIPLINAIYESNPNIGLYTLPLIVWHPMQLVIGSFLAPRLAAFVDAEEEKVLESDKTNENSNIEEAFEQENSQS